MNFLAPLFLAGAAAVALPVIFHLIRRSVKERTVFSSLMFLQPSPPRLTRRSRLEHLLLLALRCAALCLLALGFARPFVKKVFPQSPPPGSARRLLVLVDTSASMRRQGVWDAAKVKASAVIRSAAPADALGLCAFDRQLRVLVGFDEWNAAEPGSRASIALGRLSQVQPGWAGTALDRALTEAAELFGAGNKSDAAVPCRIVVVSDFQEGSRMAALQGHQWPNGVEVEVERVGPAARPSSNAGLQLLTDAADAPVALAAPQGVRVRVVNASDSKREQFQAGWATADGQFVGAPANLYVPAGQTRIVSIAAPPGEALPDRLVLRGDDEPFDNTVYTAPPARQQATVSYIGAERPDDERQPLFFLKRALQDTRRQTIRLVTLAPDAELTGTLAQTAALVVVTAPVNPSQAEALRQAMTQGTTVLFAPTSDKAAAALAPFFGLATEDASGPTSSEQTSAESPATAPAPRNPSRYSMLAEIDFGHPLFAAFADARFNDFTKIHFWTHRKFQLPPSGSATRALARFDNGDPAVLETRLGRGHGILLASGWHPAESQLALSSKFVPMLYALIELGLPEAAPPEQFSVGASVPVAAGARVRLPSGETRNVTGSETNLTLLEPGIYTIESTPGQTSPTRIAVNLEPSESRTGPLPPDELERLGVPGQRVVAAAAPVFERARLERLRDAEVESRQKLWRWFIVTTFAVLLVETLLAGRTARRGAAKGEEEQEQQQQQQQQAQPPGEQEAQQEPA